MDKEKHPVQVCCVARAEETRELGARCARCAAPGDVFALIGGLGAGKTEFVRGFMHALNPQVLVTSPSFTLVNSYSCPHFMVHHFDFYRLSHVDELQEIGFDEYINGEGLCCIEWADMFPECIPDSAYTLRFQEEDQCQRKIYIDPPIALK